MKYRQIGRKQKLDKTARKNETNSQENRCIDPYSSVEDGA